MTTLDAKPGPCEFDPKQAALVIIDMQRDFLAPGGFGEALGNDVGLLRECIAPCRALLDAARKAHLTIIHTREGHQPDLSDVPPEKLARCTPGKAIGDPGPMGRILIRGEYGHDFIDELRPQDDEIIIDKPGKGAFYNTGLAAVLDERQISTLVICGVTSEVCVNTTVREANDRGYRVIVPEDCCASYFPALHNASMAMISAQNGIFGYTCTSSALLNALTA